MSGAPPNSMEGVTLELALNRLLAHYGWDGLGQRVEIKCFTQDPSVKSSLTFLRKTPWARKKVEDLYRQTRFAGQACATMADRS